MSERDLKRFLERCHGGQSGFDAWLADLAPALGHVVAPREGICIGAGRPPFGVRPNCASGLAERIMPAFGDLPDETLRAAYRPFLVTRVSRLLERATMAGAPAFAAIAALGYVDAIGVIATDGPSVVLTVIPLAGHDGRSDREPLLYRVRRHIQSALLARRAPSGADVVTDPEGRLLHAGTARSVAPELLRAAARAYDAERRGTEPDADSARVWRELWAGGWAVVEAVDTDGKRMLVLRRDPSNPRATALDPRERRALELLARGASYKGIAAELGTGLSTASEVTAGALAKLGFKTRVDFVRHMGTGQLPKK
jgi:DNA-binding CsgD family transcriptional regulator